MAVVDCPHCARAVKLPDPWNSPAYTCPHCRLVVSTAPPAPPPAPRPPPLPQPPPEDDFNTDPEPVSPRRRRPSNNPVGDFLTFRLMITPVIIQMVFWAGVLLCVGQGLVMIGASFEVRKDFSPILFASGAALMFIGPLVIRILCELDIILFKIHDELKSSNDRHRYRS